MHQSLQLNGTYLKHLSSHSWIDSLFFWNLDLENSVTLQKALTWTTEQKEDIYNRSIYNKTKTKKN